MKKILSILFLLASINCISQSAYLPLTQKSATLELIRPANTSAYTALDVVGNDTAGLVSPAILSFTSVATSKNSNSPVPAIGYITQAVIFTDQSACTAQFRLHLFTSTLTAIVDNAPYTALYTSASKKIGQINFAACATEGAGSTSASSTAYLSMPFRLPSASTTIYGILEAIDGFTPASGQKFFIKLMFDSN